MKDETKNEQTNIGEAKPKFQQAEPAEINEADLQGVAGGAMMNNTFTNCTGCQCKTSWP